MLKVEYSAQIEKVSVGQGVADKVSLDMDDAVRVVLIDVPTEEAIELIVDVVDVDEEDD